MIESLCIASIDADLEDEVNDGNWATMDASMLCVADQEYEILGDPDNIDDALLLACVITETMH